MARSPSTLDAFTAIAEPRRRAILGVLARERGAGIGWRTTAAVGGASSERDVSWLVSELGWSQPQVSKHLGVLRRVGLVSVVRKGRRRMYSLDAAQLRSVFEWVKTYERLWEDHLDRIKDRAERIHRKTAGAWAPDESSLM